MKQQIIEKLEKLNPCLEAVDFARKYNTAQGAWDSCERGDWMLWLLGKLSDKPESNAQKKLVLVACRCARLSLRFIPKGEKRPLKAIQTAEKWAQDKGGVTIQDVRNAAAAAYAYAASAAYAAAYPAANAAGNAANAAGNAAAAYAYAASAAYAAAYPYAVTNAAAGSAAAYKEILKKCAKIVRKYYPKAPRLR